MRGKLWTGICRVDASRLRDIWDISRKEKLELSGLLTMGNRLLYLSNENTIEKGAPGAGTECAEHQRCRGTGGTEDRGDGIQNWRGRCGTAGLGEIEGDKIKV